MPASILVNPQDQDLPGNPDNVIKALNEDVVDTPEVTDQQSLGNPEPAESAIPDKYRGKTVEDVIKMHTELESLYGRMANDLGTQRKLTDQLLELKREEDLRNNSPEPLPEITSGDLLDNPQETLDKYIEAKTSGTTNAALERVQALEASLAQQQFATKHPDVNTVTASEEFQSWLSKNPLRMQAAQLAAQGDWNTADALLSDFKEFQALAQPQQPPNQNLKAAQAASLESGKASSSAVKGSTGPVISRADLMRLRLEKPDVYADPTFQAKIVQAYAEGRVK